MDESKRLRVLLDKRGIEHKDNDTPLNGVTSYMTTWHCANGKLVSFIETEIPHSTKLRIYNPTPEQAIAATVGTGYGVQFAATLDRPHETMVGETVFDSEGNAIGWITNTTAGAGTCRYVPERTATIVKVPRQSHVALGHYECGGCGATIDAGDRYCRRCGARLEGAIE